MRATVLPYAIIQTKVFGQYDGQGVYCGLSTASEMFLISTTQLYKYFPACLFLIARSSNLKYSFLHTPKQQYFMLLTSGG